MMPPINWAVLCEDYKIGEKVSLLGVFAEMLRSSVPGVASKFFLLMSASVETDGSVVEFSVSVVSPGGRPLAHAEETRRPEHAGIFSHNIVFDMDGLPIPETGNYSFEIFINGQKVHVVPLRVSLFR